MRDSQRASAIVAASSALILATDLLHISQLTLLQIVTVIIGLTLVLLSVARRHLLSTLLQSYGKWVFLFIGTTLVQLIILALGDIRSPFLILLHLTTLGLSLVFSFAVSSVFLVSALLVLILHLILTKQADLVTSDPVTFVLYGLSFATILPISRLIAQHYHLNEQFAQLLSRELSVNQAVIAAVQEIIFVTDQQGSILSANDAAEHLLQKSRAELVERPLFDLLYLRDPQGQLLTINNFTFDPHTKDQTMRELRGIQLLASGAGTQREIILRVKPIYNVDGEGYQLSFYLADPRAGQTSEHVTYEQTQLRYEALANELQQQLAQSRAPHLSARLQLITAIEQDIFLAQSLDEERLQPRLSLTDLARLVRQTAQTQVEFAAIFQRQLVFTLPDFRPEETAGLITPTIAVRPEDLTGPLFTAATDSRLFGLIVQKLTQLAAMLATSSQSPVIHLELTRHQATHLILSITLPCQHPLLSNSGELFQRYYGQLLTQTGLAFGSGLEGYLAMQLSHLLGYQLWVAGATLPDHISIHVAIPRQQLAAQPPLVVPTPPFAS